MNAEKKTILVCLGMIAPCTLHAQVIENGNFEDNTLGFGSLYVSEIATGTSSSFSALREWKWDNSPSTDRTSTRIFQYTNSSTGRIDHALLLDSRDSNDFVLTTAQISSAGNYTISFESFTRQITSVEPAVMLISLRTTDSAGAQTLHSKRVTELSNNAKTNQTFSFQLTEQDFKANNGGDKFILHLQNGFSRGDIIVDNFEFTPEPSSIAMLALGSLCLISKRRR